MSRTQTALKTIICAAGAWLLMFRGAYLCVEEVSGVAKVVGRAEHEARRDIFLFDVSQLHFDVLSGRGGVRFLVVAPQG